MSELQLSLLALGAVFVAAVAIYNRVVERRARRRAEEAFRASHPDALLEGGVPRAAAEGARVDPVIGPVEAAPGRQDPTLGALDAVLDPVELPEAAGRGADAQPLPPPDAGSVLSDRIDTLALVLADEPVTRAQVEPLLDALQAHATPVHVEGLVDEQWVAVESSPADQWRELRVGLQLASRAGPLAEEEVAAFNETLAGFAASLNAVSQRENAAAAAARARELDRFCAEVDIELGVNLVGRGGATFALARLATLALENGFAQTGSGSFERRSPDGTVAMTIRLLDGEARRDSGHASGITFAIDVPHVADPVAVFDELVRVAERFGAALGGDLVDDDRRVLGPGGVAAIRRSLEQVVRRMQAHGIAAGSALARRLFT